MLIDLIYFNYLFNLLTSNLHNVNRSSDLDDSYAHVFIEMSVICRYCLRSQ
jgi:hypothetical protein